MLVAVSVQAVSPLDKAARTPAQRKLTSQLLSAIRRATTTLWTTLEPSKEPLVKIDARQRALVDARAAVTADMNRQLVRLGATKVSIEADSLIAWVPLLKLKSLLNYRRSVRSNRLRKPFTTKSQERWAQCDLSKQRLCL